MPGNKTPCCRNCFYSRHDLFLFRSVWCWHDIPSVLHHGTYVCENYKALE